MGWFWALHWRTAFMMCGIWGLAIAFLILAAAIYSFGNPRRMESVRAHAEGMFLLIALVLIGSFVLGLLTDYA